MIERVLLTTLFSGEPKVFTSAFRGILGNENVTHFNAKGRISLGDPRDVVERDFVEECERFRPDWVFIQMQGDPQALSPAAVREARRRLPKCVFMNWTGDVREGIPVHLVDMCAATHLTILTNAGQLDMYRKAGAPRVEYIQTGVYWDNDVVAIPDWEPPFRVPAVVFAGNDMTKHLRFPGTAQRKAVLESMMMARVDLGIVGSGWDSFYPVIGTCDPMQQSRVYRRAKVILSINHFNNIERYYSDRQLIAMASGRPVVCSYVPGLEKEFKLGEHCIACERPREFVQAVKTLLADEELARKIGTTGRAEIIRNHTWYSRILTMIPLVEEIQTELARADA